jgi:hypothetical protein
LCCREGLDKPPKPPKPAKKTDSVVDNNGKSNTSSKGSKEAIKVEARNTSSLNPKNMAATLKNIKTHSKTPTLEQVLRDGKIEVVDLVDDASPAESLVKLRRLHAKNAPVTKVQPLAKKEPKYPYNGGIPYVLETSHSSFTPINSDKGVEADRDFNSPPPPSRKILEHRYRKQREQDRQKTENTKKSSDDEPTFLQGKGKEKGLSLPTRVNLTRDLMRSQN